MEEEQPRVMTIGGLQMEIDTDQITGMRLDYAKIRRLHKQSIACMTVSLVCTLLPTTSSLAIPSWITLLKLTAAVLFAVILVLSKYAQNHEPNRPFVIRRHPNTIQIERAAELPFPAAAQVTLDSVRGVQQRIPRLNITLPAENSKKPRRIGLALFRSLTDAEQAKSEIEQFLRADETKAKPITG
ncbi:MAG: hypothetical protein ABIY70_03265 [Capsulimonas sp.]|uniref:hypothetical protein n=1 Tax=Capsulimonas sp. TaxID=2494211 RepID=UPI003263BA27